MDTKKLRQKILDLAIRGKLVPQDPNDEPASVLLERIRAEKKRLIAEGKIKRPKKSKASSVESHYQQFEIPDTWKWTTLEELIILISGQDFPSDKYSSTPKGVPYIIGASNIQNGKVVVTRWTESPTVLSEKNDLLIVCKGAGVGKMGINQIGTSHIARQIQALRPFSRYVSLEYIRVALMNGIEIICSQANGLIPGLPRDLLLKFPIPLPPLVEQMKIVNRIASALDNINALEMEARAAQDYISLLKSKILDLAMQGKLVPQDPADEPAADMLMRINPKAKIITDNPHYPRWVSTQLGEVCDFERGITFPSVAKEHTKTINNIACLRTANIHDEVDLTSLWFIDKSFLRGNSNKLIRLGDIIMSTANSRELVGRSVIIKTCEEEMTFGGFVTAIRTSVLSPAFLQLFLKYKTMRGDFSKIATQTTNIANLNTKILSGVYISFPCLMEQKRIVAKIEQLYQILDEIEASLQS